LDISDEEVTFEVELNESLENGLNKIIDFLKDEN